MIKLIICVHSDLLNRYDHWQIGDGWVGEHNEPNCPIDIRIGHCTWVDIVKMARGMINHDWPGDLYRSIDVILTKMFDL